MLPAVLIPLGFLWQDNHKNEVRHLALPAVILQILLHYRWHC